MTTGRENHLVLGEESRVWVAPAGTPPPGTRRGLGREQIERHREVPPPARIGLGEAVAGLFGATIANTGDDGAAEPFVYRPNRAQRRAAAKRRRP